MSIIKQILILLFWYSHIFLSAQETANKNPKKAAFYSAIIPGSGQIYTEKYWKVPIIYAGLITSGYFIQTNSTEYQKYKTAAILSNQTAENQLGYTYSQLITLTDYYRRNREISLLFFIGTYLLNIVDASVSAHLFDYDISDDLSLQIQPVYISIAKVPGLSLHFNL